MCVSAACPAGAAGGGIPISIFLPFPRSPEGFLPGYLFIAPAGCRPPAAGSKTQPWGKGRAVNSRLSPPTPASRLCFPKSEAGWEKGAVVLALEGSRREGDGNHQGKLLAGVWDDGTGVAFGMLCGPSPASVQTPRPPQSVAAQGGQSQSRHDLWEP